MDDMLASYIYTQKKYIDLCVNEEINLIKYCVYNNNYNKHTCKVLHDLYTDCIKFKRYKK